MTNEILTNNEKAYDMGYEDSFKCNTKISYEDWCSEGVEGSYSSYKAGYEDAENDYAEEDNE